MTEYVIIATVQVKGIVSKKEYMRFTLSRKNANESKAAKLTASSYINEKLSDYAVEVLVLEEYSSQKHGSIRSWLIDVNLDQLYPQVTLGEGISLGDGFDSLIPEP